MSSRYSGRAFYAGLLEALTHVIGSAKGYLADHGPRVGMLSVQIGEALGLSRRETSELLFASILSDVGMVGLAEEAADSPAAPLLREARAQIQGHPLRSERHVRLIPHLQDLAPLVRHHHERWDGRGYPDGLVDGSIPLGAQILRLADTVTALGQARPHRPALPEVDVIREVRRSAGREVGPEVAGAFLALHRSGELPAYDPKAFRHALTRASEHLIPTEVSPLSIDQLLTILSNLIDAKDPYTAGHSRRVAALAVAVAAQLGLQEHTKATLWAGGYLHDLGKLRVPLRILTKRGTLTRAEFEQVKAHPTDGAAMLQAIPSLRHLTTGARYHHERWDGSGYPEGLKGENIPLVGQVLTVCDCYDAMTSRRTHRSFMTHEEAMGYVARKAGLQFSPRIADAFLSLPEPLFERIGRQPQRRRVVPAAERRVARRPTPHSSIPAARAG